MGCVCDVRGAWPRPGAAVPAEPAAGCARAAPAAGAAPAPRRPPVPSGTLRCPGAELGRQRREGAGGVWVRLLGEGELRGCQLPQKFAARNGSLYRQKCPALLRGIPCCLR